MKQEYELITHNNVNFHIFLVNVIYRTPHFHKDFELGLSLDNEFTMILSNHEEYVVRPGQVYVINSFVPHEIRSNEGATILSMQVPSTFFSSFYPNISMLIFEKFLIEDSKINETILLNLVNILRESIYKKEYYEFECASYINSIFVELLKNVPHVFKDPEHIQTFIKRAERMNSIIDYIDEHYSEKLLLSDIAKTQGLNLYYLSHLFTEYFGMSFQNYLGKLRCKKAREMLSRSDLKLLDISIACGFSDPKYMKKSFLQQYGCSPKDFRKEISLIEDETVDENSGTTQEYLDSKETLKRIDRYVELLFDK